MTGKKKLAIIGLDTSHSIEFPRLMQGDAPKKVTGLQAVTCLRFPSPFQTEKQQDARQKTLEGWGVKVTTSFAEAVRDIDGVMLEINDPAQHLKYFRKCADLKKPVFIDKPLAKDMADARKIVALAKKKRIKAWEASSLRFCPALAAAKKKAGNPVLCNIYGALGIAPAGSSVVWYGCHTFQMMHQVMGGGARELQSVEGGRGVVTMIDYDNGRRGVIESVTGSWKYGGRIQSEEEVVNFEAVGGYMYLMQQIRAFFLKGTIPVSLSGALEAQAMLEAAEKSLVTGKKQKVRL